MTNKNKILGTAQETRIVKRAKDVGLEARKQPGSGVYKDFPADLVIGSGLGEAKTRSSYEVAGRKVVQFELEWLKQVVRQSEENGFEWGAVFFHPKGTQEQYVFLTLDSFLELVKKSQPEGKIG